MVTGRKKTRGSKMSRNQNPGGCFFTSISVHFIYAIDNAN